MRHAFIIAALALTLGACSTQRRSADTTQTVTPTDAVQTPAAQTPPGSEPHARFAAMTAAYGLWQDVQMPVRATIRSPFSISASGRLTMVQGKLIHISVRLLGMEVAVMQVTPDSVFVVDKFHRYLIAEPTEKLTARTGLTVGDMQNALLGRAFLPGQGAATASMSSRLTLGEEDGMLSIAPADAPAGYTWRMHAATLDDGRVALADLIVSVDGQAPATAAYTPAAQLSPIGAIATAVDLRASVAGKKIDARLSYTADQARWNTGTTPSLPSLRGYTRVSAATLLKSGFL